MADSTLGGFAQGLQGGLGAGAQLDQVANQATDNSVKSILSLRNLQIEDAKNKAAVTNKAQDKAIAARTEVINAIKDGLTEGDPAKVQTAIETAQHLMTPATPPLPGGRPGLTSADILDSNAGLPPGTTNQYLQTLIKVTPGATDKAAAAGLTSNAQTTGTINANLAQAPAVNANDATRAGMVSNATTTGANNANLAQAPQLAAAAATQAGAVSTAQGQAAVDVATTNRPAIAANAGATTAADQAATPPAIVKLQHARDLAIAAGDQKAANEISGQITAYGSSQTFDPRAATTTPFQEVRTAAQGLSSALDANAELLKTQEMFKAAPGAAGLLGRSIETLSGFSQQFSQLTGAPNFVPNDPSINRARTQMRLVLRGNLASAKGSGKLTNDQVKRADEALRGLSDAGSDQQVQQALNVAIDLNKAVALTNARTLVSNYNLETEDGATSALSALTKNGLGQAAAVDMLARLRLARR